MPDALKTGKPWLDHKTGRMKPRDMFPIFGRFLIGLIATVGPVFASPDTSNTANMCDLAASKAADDWNVPLDVLRAISRTETGRAIGGKLQPWPWTVNMEGHGEWFGAEDEARAYVFQHFKRGARSFDVGCFQINYKWHGAAFRSIDEMFDPILNANYAARFLRDLYQEFGDWTSAAGAFHSRTRTHAENYSARFEEIRDTMTAFDQTVGLDVRNPSDRPERQRSDPFSSSARAPLIRGGTGRMGSLVPSRKSGSASLQAIIAMNSSR